MSGTEYGTLILDVLGGVGALLIGVGVLIGSLAIARELTQFRATLKQVVDEIDQIREPVINTLEQVDKLVKSAQSTADSVSQTADLTKSAVVPAIVNIGATVGGVTAGLRRLVSGKDRNDRE
ncbi:MAG: hypothetical protein WAL67_07395 [Candidatus Cybelea sp.]